MRIAARLALAIVLIAAPSSLRAEDSPTPAEVKAGLLKAVSFFHESVGVHGGYVWKTSTDLKRREGEGVTTPSMVWVQPPATPTIGEAFLDAYEATGDERCLKAARDAGECLLKGQLHSGGWTYFIEFDPEKRQVEAFRDVPLRKKHKNRSTLDDDTTQSCLRFLARLDKTLDFKDQSIHEASLFGHTALLRAQFPNGGFPHFWDGTVATRNDADYPVKPASFPEEWQRKWPKDFKGCYVLNDDLIPDLVNTLFVAHAVYADEKYLKAAEKAGEFLVLAQLPEPQPGWAQQYNARMQPEWSRKFEPPAVTGGESQGVMQTLILLAKRTGRQDFLKPIPSALAYYRRSQLPNGQMARFYELKTNKPLYFVKDTYELTYDDGKLPTHYGFKLGHKWDRIERDYKAALAGTPEKPSQAPGPPSAGQRAAVTEALKTLDDRGAWVDRGKLKSDVGPVPEGVILSERFVANVKTLCAYLEARAGR